MDSVTGGEVWQPQTPPLIHSPLHWMSPRGWLTLLKTPTVRQIKMTFRRSDVKGVVVQHSGPYGREPEETNGSVDLISGIPVAVAWIFRVACSGKPPQIAQNALRDVVCNSQALAYITHKPRFCLTAIGA